MHHARLRRILTRIPICVLAAQFWSWVQAGGYLELLLRRPVLEGLFTPLNECKIESSIETCIL